MRVLGKSLASRMFFRVLFICTRRQQVGSLLSFTYVVVSLRWSKQSSSMCEAFITTISPPLSLRVIRRSSSFLRFMTARSSLREMFRPVVTPEPGTPGTWPGWRRNWPGWQTDYRAQMCPAGILGGPPRNFRMPAPHCSFFV